MTIEEKNYLIHPHYIILILILSSVSALFFGFSFAYLYSRIQSGIEPVQIPQLFYFNSLILLMSSFVLIRAKKAYTHDRTELFKLLLWIALLFTIIFLIAQVFGWLELIRANVHMTTSNLASYLYVISGLHFAHVIVGIPFLSYFIWIAHKRLKEPVSVLIYFSDPDKKRKLDLLNIYWHFLDALWIYLVLFFLVNSLI